MTKPTEKSAAIAAHEKWRGKLEITPRCPLNGKEALSLAYTPGVAEACLEIAADPARAGALTRKWNTVAVVTDGSAVLGLGNIGALAGLPVMEGKAVLFREFGGVDAFPILLSTQDTEEIISAVKAIAPSFGGINLEDISAPRCFEIERRLAKELDIPVFHDDQHGTAVVVLAGLINSLKLAGKSAEQISVVINGPGAAGNAIARLLLAYGVKDIVMCDRSGALYAGREKMDEAKSELAKITNLSRKQGSLSDVLEGADAFIGVSAAGALKPGMVAKMNQRAIVFALANPVPEILPEEAAAAGAFVAATGRSDFPNQINNLLAFPGIFRGLLDSKAKQVTVRMKLAAAKAIASFVKDSELSPDFVVPSPLDKGVAAAVARAVYFASSDEA